MKLLKNMLIIMFVLAAVSSCGRGDADDRNELPDGGSEAEEQASDQGKKDEEIFLSGQVITVSYNTDGIADFTLLTDGSAVCRVTPGEVSLSAVAVGQEVLITVDGSVMESDPMQAVAKNVDVTEEFNEMPMPAEIYTVYDIVASKVSEALTSSGYRFYRFEDYEECLDFLAENDLSEEFDKTVGNTDISALTDSFFEQNDLGVFVVNNAGSMGNKPKELYYDGEDLYLAVTQNSENAVLVNTKFDAFLMPLSKDIEIGEGIVLTEKFLQPYVGEDQQE